MRYGILAVGILAWIVACFQIVLVAGLSDIANDESAEQSAALGVLGLFIWLLALIIVIPWPRAAMVTFLLAAGAMFAGVSNFPDLGIWGGVAAVFGVLSYIGLRQKRGIERKERERDNMFAQMMAAQQTMATAMTAPVSQMSASSPMPIPSPATSVADTFPPCATCGGHVTVGQRYCPSCGSNLGPDVPAGSIAS